MEVERLLQRTAAENANAATHVCFLGAGVYDHYIPAAVPALAGRGEFFTAYTPYQAEASQGTLQAIFEYQTMMCELSGMDVANASHYDGATALAECAAVAYETTGRCRLLLAAGVHPVYRRVVETYLAPHDVVLEEVPAPDGVSAPDEWRRRIGEDVAAVVVQNPNYFGCIEDIAAVAEIGRAAGAVPIACGHPIALAVLRAPGECGFTLFAADGQPLGNEMSAGGPSLGILAAKDEMVRRIPGRLVGEARDAGGRRAFVLTLQTREQHIRRERASSNICTNQGLMALRAAIYVATMGAEGLRRVASLCVERAHELAERICAIRGFEMRYPAPFFMEFAVRTPLPPAELNRRLWERGFIGGADLGNAWLLCATEKRTPEEIEMFARAVEEVARG